jgi:hypothetical protein
LKFRDSFSDINIKKISAGYVQPLNLDDTDDTEMESLLDMNTVPVQHIRKDIDKTLGPYRMLWSTDSNIQIDNHNLTFDDILKGNNVYGHENMTIMPNPTKQRKYVNTHSTDILKLTDYTPTYGEARGEVTMG